MLGTVYTLSSGTATASSGCRLGHDCQSSQRLVSRGTRQTTDHAACGDDHWHWQHPQHASTSRADRGQTTKTHRPAEAERFRGTGNAPRRAVGPQGHASSGAASPHSMCPARAASVSVKAHQVTALRNLTNQAGLPLRLCPFRACVSTSPDVGMQSMVLCTHGRSAGSIRFRCLRHRRQWAAGGARSPRRSCWHPSGLPGHLKPGNPCLRTASGLHATVTPHSSVKHTMGMCA